MKNQVKRLMSKHVSLLLGFSGLFYAQNVGAESMDHLFNSVTEVPHEQNQKAFHMKHTESPSPMDVAQDEQSASHLIDQNHDDSVVSAEDDNMTNLDHGGMYEGAEKDSAGLDVRKSEDNDVGDMSDLDAQIAPVDASEAGLSDEDIEKRNKVLALLDLLSEVHAAKQKQERPQVNLRKLFTELYVLDIQMNQKSHEIIGAQPESYFPVTLAATHRKLLSPALRLGMATILRKVWTHITLAKLEKKQIDRLMSKADFSAIQERNKGKRYVITVTFPKDVVLEVGLDRSDKLHDLVEWSKDEKLLSFSVSFDPESDNIKDGKLQSLRRRFYTALVNVAPSSEDLAAVLSKASRPKGVIESKFMQLNQILKAIKKNKIFDLEFNMGIAYDKEEQKITHVHGDQGKGLPMPFVERRLKAYFTIYAQEAYTQLRKKMRELLNSRLKASQIDDFLASEKIIFSMEDIKGESDHDSRVIVVFTVNEALHDEFNLGSMGGDTHGHYAISLPKNGDDPQFFKFTNKEATAPNNLHELEVASGKETE